MLVQPLDAQLRPMLQTLHASWQRYRQAIDALRQAPLAAGGAQIEQAVGRINGRYAMLDWTPVRFFARALAFEEVLAHYAAADVMWITPLRDGLNLVAKEFVAAHGIEGSAGTLVLSEFAGAAAELKGAVLTNPHDQTDLVAGLRQALAMPDHEAVGRQRQLFETVRYYDVERWGRDFLASVASSGSGADQHRYAMRGLAA